MTEKWKVAGLVSVQPMENAEVSSLMENERAYHKKEKGTKVERENETREEKRERIAQKILFQARNELYLEMPFLDCALGALSFQKKTEICGIGTDGTVIFYDQRDLFAWYQEEEREINRRYLHLLFHGIFLHWHQAQKKDSFWWNLSCDLVVEFAIDQLAVRKIAKRESKKRESWYSLFFHHQKIMTAEKMELWLREHVTEEEAREMAVEFYGDDHTLWYPKKVRREEEMGSRAGKEAGKHADEEGEAEARKKTWQQIGQKVMLNLEVFSKKAGSAAGNLKAQIRQANRKKYDYRRFLKKFMTLREQMKVDIDSFDYGFYQYGLSMYGKMPIIEPLEYKEEEKLEEFVIAIDTSASCSHGLIAQFLGETMAILEQGNFFGAMRLHLIQCDNEIQEDVCITDEKSFREYLTHFEAKGLGGTDFRPVFCYIERLLEEKKLTNLRGMIYFTDGYGTFPRKKPDYEAAFVFLTEEPREVEVPVWAIKIFIEAEDLRRGEI